MIAFMRPAYRVPIPIRQPSERQLQVARLCGEGMSYVEIARELGISPRTAKMHVHAVAALLPGTREPYLRVCLFGVRLLVADEERRSDAGEPDAVLRGT